jgi:hypothetical protein
MKVVLDIRPSESLGDELSVRELSGRPTGAESGSSAEEWEISGPEEDIMEWLEESGYEQGQYTVISEG